MQRSPQRIVYSEIDVKSWTERRPSCGAVRPSHCPSCASASRPVGAPLVVVGHGLRARSLEGPAAPGEAPVVTDVHGRRYVCRACGAVLVVVIGKWLAARATPAAAVEITDSSKA